MQTDLAIEGNYELIAGLTVNYYDGDDYLTHLILSTNIEEIDSMSNVAGNIEPSNLPDNIYVVYEINNTYKSTMSYYSDAVINSQLSNTFENHLVNAMNKIKNASNNDKYDVVMIV